MVRCTKYKNGFTHFVALILILLVGAVVGVSVIVINQNKKTVAGSSNHTACVSNPNAMFTHDFTEPDKLSFIQPPAITDTNIRDQSWPSIDTTKTVRVFMYAPADAYLISGIYKVEKVGQSATDYDLWFQISYERWFFINHISNPVDQVKDLLPKSPNTSAANGSSATAGRVVIKPSIFFKSGEKLGYTTGTSQAHNFDLGVFDNNHQNIMPISYKQGPEGRERHAICSFDLFPAEIKVKFYEIRRNKPDHFAYSKLLKLNRRQNYMLLFLKDARLSCGDQYEAWAISQANV